MAAIKDIADRSCTQGKPVGILTGNDRDTWAKNYSLLLGLFQFIFSFVPFMFNLCSVFPNCIMFCIIFNYCLALELLSLYFQNWVTTEI